MTLLAGSLTVAYSSENLCNKGLRPFLTKWHPALQVWEAERPSNLSPKAHEKNCSEEPQLRRELKELNQALEQYANALAVIVGVDPS